MLDSSCEVGWREVPKGPSGNPGSWSQMKLFFFLSHHSFWVAFSDRHHQMPTLAPHSVIDSVLISTVVAHRIPGAPLGWCPGFSPLLSPGTCSVLLISTPKPRVTHFPISSYQGIKEQPSLPSLLPKLTQLLLTSRAQLRTR